MVFFWKQPHTYSIWGFIRSGSDRSVSEIAANVTVNGFHRNESLGLEWERERKKARIKLREKDRRKMSLWLLRRSSAVSQTLVQGKKFGRCFHFPVPFFSQEIPPIGFIFAFVAPGQRQMCQRKRAKSNQKHLPLEPQVEEQASLLFLVGVTIQTVVMDPVWEWSTDPVWEWSSDPVIIVGAWPRYLNLLDRLGRLHGSVCVFVWQLSLLLVRANETCFMAGSLVLCHTPQADRRGNILICVSSR